MGWRFASRHGPGIPKRFGQNFDPFFTTKEVGKGREGLAIAHTW